MSPVILVAPSVPRRLVHEYGEGQWSQIAQALNDASGKSLESGRIGKQCRERWSHHLRPDIKKVCGCSSTAACLSLLGRGGESSDKS